MRENIDPLPGAYLQGVMQLYNNAAAVYGENNLLSGDSYPLMPLKAFYRSLKYHCIGIIRQMMYSRIHGPALLGSLSLKAV
jgi:hypothetical protein